MSVNFPKRLPGRKWQHCILLLLLCIAAGFFISGLFRSDERGPRFKGRTLNAWVGELRRPNAAITDRQIAEDAIRAMGTNVIPGIMTSMDRPDQTALLPLYTLGLNVGLVKKVPDTVQWSDDWYTRQLANHIAPDARPHVLDALFAAYAECSDQHESGNRRRENLMLAIHSFGGLAPEHLRERMASSSPGTRAASASLVGYIGDAPEELIPILGSMLTDEDPAVRFHALAALGRYRGTPQPQRTAIIAHLRTGLDDPTAHVRSFAARMLSFWGKHAEAAVPRLTELVRMERAKTTGVHDTTFMNALRSVDPRAAEELEAIYPKSDDRPPNE